MFDATNSTRERRQLIVDHCVANNIKVCIHFVVKKVARNFCASKWFPLFAKTKVQSVSIHVWLICMCVHMYKEVLCV